VCHTAAGGGPADNGRGFDLRVSDPLEIVGGQLKGVRVNYQSIGSGGIAQIKAATVDFGASDAPLPPDQLTAAGLAQFPVGIGGVVPVFNIEGIEGGQQRRDL
jgi:ABC-type phosphate transport system substrate-binding protein